MTEHRYTGDKPEKEVFEVFHDTMEQLILEDKGVVYLDADLMGSLKTQDLWKKYPERVFNTGIQEANMVGMACGLYLNGFKPYIHSFNPFMSRRIFDQMFISGAYAGKSIRLIGSDAGIMATMNGGTHMCFEDVAMMRTVPGACIVDVSDPGMCGFFLKETADRPGVTYIRMPRRDLPDIYKAGETFEEGKCKVLRAGRDVMIIACGIMVGTCLKATDILSEKGIDAGVMDIVTVKPIDREAIVKYSKDVKLVVSAENANINGGLGSAVAEVMTEENPRRLLRIGVEDQFGCVGREEYLRQKYGLTAEQISERICLALNGGIKG